MLKLILLFLSFSIYSQETIIVFCSSSTSSDALFASLKNYSSPNDKVINSGAGCVEVITQKNKEELFQRIMKIKYPDISIQSTSDSSASGDNCRIQIIKEQNKNLTNQDVSINNKIKIKEANSNSQGQEISQLLVSENSWASFTVELSEYQLKCRKINADSFEIQISSKSSNSNLSSTLTLMRNQKFEIMSNLKNLDDDNKNIGIPAGIQKQKINGKDQFKIYLLIE